METINDRVLVRIYSIISAYRRSRHLGARLLRFAHVVRSRRPLSAIESVPCDGRWHVRIRHTFAFWPPLCRRLYRFRNVQSKFFWRSIVFRRLRQNLRF